MMLIINRANGNQQVVAPQVVGGLKTCTNFNTVEAHAAHLATTREKLSGKEALLASGATADFDPLSGHASLLGSTLSHALHTLNSGPLQAQQLPSQEWQAYLKRGVEEAQQALVTQHSPTGIPGIPDDITESELIAEFRNMASGFAAALSGWVEMREVASALADEMIASRKIYPL
jgi:hypothetical protein